MPLKFTKPSRARLDHYFCGTGLYHFPLLWFCYGMCCMRMILLEPLFLVANDLMGLGKTRMQSYHQPLTYWRRKSFHLFEVLIEISKLCELGQTLGGNISFHHVRILWMVEVLAGFVAKISPKKMYFYFLYESPLVCWELYKEHQMIHNFRLLMSKFDE